MPQYNVGPPQGIQLDPVIQASGSIIPGANMNPQLQGAVPNAAGHPGLGPMQGFPQPIVHPNQPLFGPQTAAQQMDAMGPFNVGMQNMGLPTIIPSHLRQGHPLATLGTGMQRFPPGPQDMMPVDPRFTSSFLNNAPSRIPRDFQMLSAPGHLGHEPLGLRADHYERLGQFQPMPIPEDQFLRPMPRPRIPPSFPPSLSHPLAARFPQGVAGDPMRRGPMGWDRPSYVIVDRTYGYPEYPKPYPQMPTDVNTLVNCYHGAMSGMDSKYLIDILAQRSPSEMVALRHAFRQETGGTNIDLALMRYLDEYEQEEKLAFLGLALGNILFDVYIIENVCYPNYKPD
jgi:hypothetical protein